MRTKSSTLIGASLVALGAAFGPAGAQTAPSNTAADQTSQKKPGAVIEEKIETVVVTGEQWRKEQDKPLPVTLHSAEDRNLMNAQTARELVNITPGFVYSDAFGLNVRGIGRQTAQTLLGQENTVTEYIDGFINLVPFNIAESTLFGGNVEFLQGPQGDLYGRNAIAGAVNLVSRAPTPQFTAEGVAGVGRGGSYNVGVNMAGPITDDLGIRIGAQWYDDPSLQKNIGSAKGAGFALQNLYLELQLEWTDGPFHIRTRTTHFDYHDQPGYTSPAAYDTTDVFGGLAPNPQYHYAVPSPQKPYEINVDFAGFDNLDNNIQQIVNADYDFGPVKLFYVGGYQQYLATGSSDLDLTSRASYVAAPTDPFFPGTVVPTFYTANYRNDNKFWSHELRLESQTDGPFRWLLGFYYFNQQFDESYWEAIPGSPLLATPTANAPGATTAPNPRLATYQQRNIYGIYSQAVFGHVTYDITPKLSLDAGIRETWDQKNAHTNFRYVFSYPPFFAGDVTPLLHSANPHRAEDGLSGRAALIWRPDDGTQAYASYSRGYQSSAFTLGQGLPPNNIANAEFLDVYELGLTHIFPDGIRLQGTAFLQRFHNMQIPISTRSVNGAGLPVGPVFSQFVNAKSARLDGVEVEADWPVDENSMISANYTYIHPVFDSFCPPIPGSIPPVCGAVDITNAPAAQVPENLSGNEVPRAPRNRASIYGYYTVSLGGAGSLIPGGSIAYQDQFYASAFTKAKWLVPSSTVVNASLTWRTVDDHFELVGYISNAFREIYPDNIVVSVVGGTLERTKILGPDQFYGLTARYRY